MIKESKISENKTICSLQSNKELVGTFLTVKEVSKALRVSEDTIYRLLDKRELLYHGIGGCKRILLEDLQTYLEENKSQVCND